MTSAGDDNTATEQDHHTFEIQQTQIVEQRLQFKGTIYDCQRIQFVSGMTQHDPTCP